MLDLTQIDACAQETIKQIFGVKWSQRRQAGIFSVKWIRFELCNWIQKGFEGISSVKNDYKGLYKRKDVVEIGFGSKTENSCEIK